jgi:hypothetical protein
MSPFIPMWIIGGPFIGLLVLSFAFKGSSAMGGLGARPGPRLGGAVDPATPLFDPIHPESPRRFV